jgi:membrane protein YdbS with pleckstrin-like domain
VPLTPAPRPSWRKPAGIFLILAMLAAWAVLAVTLAEALALPFWASALVLVAAGFAWLWLLPMKRLLRWIELGKWRE